MRLRLRMCLGAAVMLVCEAGSTAAERAGDLPRQVITMVSCAKLPGLADRSAAEQARLRCGTLAVPLDDRKTDGPTLDMAFVVRAAATPSNRPPILVLAGSSSGSVRWSASTFAPPFTGDRDVVLVDTRGKDDSGLGLCDTTRRAQVAALARDLEGKALRYAFFAPLRDCRERLRAAGAPLDVYGASRIVRDLERLRVALGYERVLLFGVSHGTVVANSYAAAYPKRVEAMLLDGAYPPDPTPGTLTETFREGLAGAAAACRGNAICGPAGDDLVAAYERAFALLRREPMIIETKALGRLVLNADDLTLLVQNMLYPGVSRAVAPEVTPYAVAPALIAAVEARDAAQVARIADGPLGRLAAGPHSAVFVSGECADRTRYYNRKPEPFTGVELIDLTAVCPWWAPRPAEPARMPAGRAPPAMVITGSTDPITPISFSRDTARRLGPSVRVLAVPGAGHGTVRTTPCGRAVGLAFFADPRTTVMPDGCAPIAP
ncbi:alpha/beta fold hydrolase [Sphingomonas sp.]|uniref:alpha/beta fold hydrolase n=1 Tax=Sphingomonas sp. TaxID=28214 RepID=UPI002DF25095|nr:alpha/beta fold hydrolase [Sphingomonas sp.]